MAFKFAKITFQDLDFSSNMDLILHNLPTKKINQIVLIKKQSNIIPPISGYGGILYDDLYFHPMFMIDDNYYDTLYCLGARLKNDVPTRSSYDTSFIFQDLRSGMKYLRKQDIRNFDYGKIREYYENHILKEKNYINIALEPNLFVYSKTTLYKEITVDLELLK